ncbi:MAG: PP2C family protein-serine/threonine phosphatase [Planctomycetota bacterium]|jgi:PAS domain S-box-containing protein
MEDLSNITIEAVIDSLSDGVYVCDLERKITYWSKSAERITGWSAKDVVGKHCFDNVLCHIDKDGHQLCGEEYCPLHRSIVTGRISEASLLVYAQGADEKRIPMQVTVAPVRNAEGDIIGGVETFRDASAMVHDLERAQTIQELAMVKDVPKDIPVGFTTYYVSRDIVGGDFYAIKKLGDAQYGVMLADVMGHGISAALYTMHLSSLWDRYYPLLKNPVEFVASLNKELFRVVKGEGSFATAVCGVVDLKNGVFRFTSAGGPEVIVMHADGTHEYMEIPGMPLALMEETDYEETIVEVHKGDCILLFSDGAVEIKNAEGEMLGVDGVIDILKKQGYPKKAIRMDDLEEDLLKYSNEIRLKDDLTLIEVRFNES